MRRKEMKKIQILGTGCAKCMKLTENAEKAAKEAGIEFEIQKVQDIKEIMSYGVMMTPGLAIDGEIKAIGKVLSVEEIKRLL
jgi:small redox-active disulfide protein 2